MGLLQKTDKTPVSLSSIWIRGTILLVAIILLISAYFSHQQYTVLRDTSFEDIEKRITQEVIAEAFELQSFVSDVERDATHLADLISTGELNRDRYNEALSDLVSSNRLYFGGVIAFSPYAFSPEKRLHATYYKKMANCVSYSWKEAMTILSINGFLKR